MEILWNLPELCTFKWKCGWPFTHDVKQKVNELCYNSPICDFVSFHNFVYTCKATQCFCMKCFDGLIKTKMYCCNWWVQKQVVHLHARSLNCWQYSFCSHDIVNCQHKLFYHFFLDALQSLTRKTCLTNIHSLSMTVCLLHW